MKKIKKIYCPMCERELDYSDSVFRDKYGLICGCEHCLQESSAQEVEDELIGD